MNCFLVIDKPPGITSHDAVAMVRAVTGLAKVGHTGTLDPFATGVLPLALGRATRFIQYLDESLKIYDATISLGTATSTGDPEGEVIRQGPPPDFSRLDEVLASFHGKRMQSPPAYSAVKHKGKPLYKYARKGETVEVPARPIEIFAMKLVDRGDDWLRVEIHCTRGTYARVLADELGVALGTAGHLSALRRLRSGPFVLDHSVDLPKLSMLAAGTEEWEKALRQRGPGDERVRWRPRDEVVSALAVHTISLRAALAHLPAAPVRPQDQTLVARGGKVPSPPPGLAMGARYVCTVGEMVLAIAEQTPAGPRSVLAIGDRD